MTSHQNEVKLLADRLYQMARHGEMSLSQAQEVCNILPEIIFYLNQLAEIQMKENENATQSKME